MEYIILLKVFMCLAGCIIVISAINHKLGYDKAQQIQSVSMGIGILFCSLMLWLYFSKNMHDDLELLLYVGTLTPVTGALIGLIGLKIFKNYVKNTK